MSVQNDRMSPTKDSGTIGKTEPLQSTKYASWAACFTIERSTMYGSLNTAPGKQLLQFRPHNRLQQIRCCAHKLSAVKRFAQSNEPSALRPIGSMINTDVVNLAFDSITGYGALSPPFRGHRTQPYTTLIEKSRVILKRTMVQSKVCSSGDSSTGENCLKLRPRLQSFHDLSHDIRR
jgi:hypothetical protein